MVCSSRYCTCDENVIACDKAIGWRERAMRSQEYKARSCSRHQARRARGPRKQVAMHSPGDLARCVDTKADLHTIEALGRGCVRFLCPPRRAVVIA
eukprot:scaffold97348_cov30-Tisochrysis_lutea.AAC.2